MIGATKFRQTLGISRSTLVEEIAYFALSPRTFVIWGGFVMIASALRAYRWTPALADVAPVVLVALGSLGLGAVVGRLLRAVMPRAQMWWAALLLWVSVALFRHLAEVAVSRIELDSSAQVTALSVALSTGTALVWLFLLAGFQAVNSLQRSVTEDLRQGIERLRRETERRWTELDNERTRLAALVQRTIRPALKELIAVFCARDVIAPAAGFADLVSGIAEDARNLVREASHEMKHLAQRSAALDRALTADPAPVRTNQVKRPFLAAAGARVEPMSVFVAVPALGFAAPAPVSATVARLLLASAISFACLALISWVLARIPFPEKTPTLLLVVGGNAVGVAAGVFVSGALIGSVAANSPTTAWWGPDSGPGLKVLVWAVGTIITTVVSLIVADRRVWMQSAVQLAQSRDALNSLDDDMRRQYERMAAQTASMLHGPIQGRLATIGMTLRFAGDQISDEEMANLELLLRECEVDLMRASLDPWSDHASAWHVLNALRTQWAGLLAITWSLTPEATDEINADSVLVRNLETLVADLASNASRHGGAKQLRLMISLTASHLRVLARDDGSGPSFPVEAGIGLGSLGVNGLAITIDPDGWCCVTAIISRVDLEGNLGAGQFTRSGSPAAL